MESDTIDLLKLWRLFRRKIWLLVLFAIIGIVLSGIVTVYFMPRVYSSDVLMYIWQDQEDKQSNALTAGDLNFFSQLVADYQVLVKSRLVTEQVAKELQLPSAAELADQITVGTKTNTRHITLSIKDEDPARAALIANKVAEVFSSTVLEKMGAGEVQIIDDAIVPQNPTSPNLRLNIIIGAFIGLMLAVGLVLLLAALDTTVRSVEDANEITGYTLLGTIPEFENFSISEKRKR